MQSYEKKAFLKFFITYFISVSLLILTSGFFYFKQMQGHLLRMEEFSLIEYARHIKMGLDLNSEFSSDYVYKIVNKKQHINITNFTITKDKFIKYIPMKIGKGYLELSKSKNNFIKELMNLRVKIISIQLLLILFFAFISYLLAKNALKPLQNSIITLDKFAKDLIHDLNTPITSIKLNMKLIEKTLNIKGNNAFDRVKKSVHSISELHENLTILLQEETFQMQLINVCNIVEDIVQVHKQLYPNINFFIECSSFKAKLNSHAMRQILQNIISNACRYNSKNGYIKIYTRENSIFIEDSGDGIKEVEKIFNRTYSEKHSSGIGLDIVKRLSTALNIQIDVKTKKDGTIFILTMD